MLLTFVLLHLLIKAVGVRKTFLEIEYCFENGMDLIDSTMKDFCSLRTHLNRGLSKKT